MTSNTGQMAKVQILGVVAKTNTSFVETANFSLEFEIAGRYQVTV